MPKPPRPLRRPTRREFLKTSAAVAGMSFWVSGAKAAQSNSPNEKIRFASVGVGNKGKEEVKDCSRHGEVVAICDIDENVLGKIGEAHPGAKRFQDWRDMFDEMASGIDAVTVSTPDHTHAVIAVSAMRMGMHAFVQKPLAHNLYEVRLLGDLAREKNVATQMGNQHTADRSLRRTAGLIKAGVVGTVKEIHVWTDRPIWPQGIARSSDKPVPRHVHWNLFLGPAPYRPFADNYHPFNWRGWWDFGTGSLGDMGCHTMNMPFMALDLRDPISVQAETSGHNRDSYPSKSRVTYEFAATGSRPALKLFWYDAGVKPGRELLSAFKPTESEERPRRRRSADEASDGKNSEEKSAAVGSDDGDSSEKRESEGDRKPPTQYAKSGCIVVGDKGMLYAPGDYAEKKPQLAGVDELEVEFPQSPGHFKEWVEAIKGGPAAMSNFSGFAAPLAETVLLGNLAIWTANEPDAPGKRIEWNAKDLTASNAPEVAHLIKPDYRAGFTL